MKYFLLAVLAFVGFQSCTSELNEIDGVVGNYIEAGSSNLKNNGKTNTIPSESFLSQYFSGGSEFPISTRIENNIRHDFNSPVNPNKDPKELSAKWTGNFYFDAGEYTFSIKSNQGIKVVIDDKVILNEVGNEKTTTYQLIQQMDGIHKLIVEYNIEEVIDTESIESINDTNSTISETNNNNDIDNTIDENTEITNSITENDNDKTINTNENTENEGTTVTDSKDEVEKTEIANNSDKVVETENETPTVEVEWTPTKGVSIEELSKDELMKFVPMGWAAVTKGGQGGKIIKVTNLNKDGKGSFREAIYTNEPRIIVFEVGGVINLEGESLRIKYPFVTILGQTAPSPGITFIRGGLNIYANDVIIQHLKIRPGENGRAKKSGWEVDGIGIIDANNIIIDHCSISWATDENLSASGPKFKGNNLSEWRKNTSHTITFSNNLIAECLNNSTHSNGIHSMGSLIFVNITEMALIGNIYVSNGDRNPLFTGGSSAAFVNNYIYNAKNFAFQYKLASSFWKGYEYVTAKFSLVGNVMEKGSDSRKTLPFSYFSGGPVDVYWDDNLVLGDPVPENRLLLGDRRVVNEPPVWHETIEVKSSKLLKEYLLENSGARPWDRDEVDIRIIDDIKAKKSKIIDSEQEVGGYPNPQPTYRKFDATKWGL